MGPARAGTVGGNRARAVGRRGGPARGTRRAPGAARRPPGVARHRRCRTAGVARQCTRCPRRSPDAMTEGGDWRARKKAATKHAIQEHALRLFIEKGYDATTVDEIAAAAGVSHMTFFRYFPRKENVVQTREYDPMIEELIVGRPPQESPLAAISAALSASFAAILPTDRQRILTRVRLMMSTPQLRALQLI